VDNTSNVQITSTHSHYDFIFFNTDLTISNLESNWFGTETVDLDCNGVSASFDLTVNNLPESTCYQVCSYGSCYDVCV